MTRHNTVQPLFHQDFPTSRSSCMGLILTGETTPAQREKVHHLEPRKHPKKHSRLRRENCYFEAVDKRVPGTPPPTRGKLPGAGKDGLDDRNTPAYAGKTCGRAPVQVRDWEHPRLRKGNTSWPASETTVAIYSIHFAPAHRIIPHTIHVFHARPFHPKSSFGIRRSREKIEQDKDDPTPTLAQKEGDPAPTTSSDTAY